MRHRHPLPRIWMMTDERQGDRLWDALDKLPKGAGVVVRHYGLAHEERRLLIKRIVKIGRAKRLSVVIAGDTPFPGAAGRHGHSKRHSPGLRTTSVHNERELVSAQRMGADLIFVSPIFATRSHPGARCLGYRGLAALAAKSSIPVIALGGMTAKRARPIAKLIHGWAGIDAWSK